MRRMGESRVIGMSLDSRLLEHGGTRYAIGKQAVDADVSAITALPHRVLRSPLAYCTSFHFA